MLTKKIDFWAGLCFLGLGVIVIFLLIPLGIDEPRKVKYAALSPSYYPRMIGIAMALIGAIIMFRTVKNTDGGQTLGAPDTNTKIKIGAVFVILAAVGLLLPWAGFVLTCAVALILLMILGGERNPLIIIGIALTLPILLYLFFGKVANIPIPAGVLEPYLRKI